jgi:PAS domain S-box-containing protein
MMNHEGGTSEKPRRGRSGSEYLRLLVDGVKDYAIFMLDPGGYVVSWNPGAERLKGYSGAEIIGEHFSRFYREQDRHKTQGELDTAVAEGRFEEEGWRVRKDGTLFWANVVITAVYQDSGELYGFAKVTRDLTERRRAEEERLRLAEAQAAVHLRDEFFSIASHELKTPLGALWLQLASLELMAGKNPPDMAALRKRLALAVTQVRRLDTLVERLLDLSRVTVGRLSLVLAPSDPTEILHSVCESFGETLREAGCELRLQVARARPLQSTWDRLRIEQVLGNLLSNALRHGRGKPIDVGMAADEHVVTYFVTDRGSGIPVEDRERVFHRFERASNSAHQGLGLGLYITRQIVEAHGGTVHVESGAEGGARLVVRLPLQPALVGAGTGEARGS